MRNLLKTVLLIGVTAAAGTALAQQENRFTRAIEIGASGELDLSNVAGDIEISGTEGTQLVLEAVKRAHVATAAELLDSVEIDISHTGDRVRVETRYPRSRHHHDRGGISVDYRVTVPEGTEVEASSVSGNVRLSGVQGPSRIVSVSGNVEGRDLGQLLKAKTVSGDVEIRRARSGRNVEISSVSGDARVEELDASDLNVSSVSGDVVLQGVSSERGALQTVSGDIRYTGAIAAAGRYELKSHSGDVVVTIDETVGFELEASTFSGEVESEFPMNVTWSGRRGRKLTGIAGDGSAHIEATTFSGDILLRRR